MLNWVALGASTNSGIGTIDVVREIPVGAIDGANTTYTLTYSPSPTQAVWLFRNGVYQEALGGTPDFSLTGNTITFSAAPDVADELEIIYFRSGTPTAVAGERRVQFGIVDTLAVGTDVCGALSLDIGTTYVFRCSFVTISADVPAVGADIKIDIEYSTDPWDTVPGSRTWNTIFSDTTGKLVLPQDVQQIQTPYTTFAAAPLDLPDRCLVRCNVKQVGSTSPGSIIYVQLVGEIWSA